MFVGQRAVDFLEGGHDLVEADVFALRVVLNAQRIQRVDEVPLVLRILSLCLLHGVIKTTVSVRVPIVCDLSTTTGPQYSARTQEMR